MQAIRRHWGPAALALAAMAAQLVAWSLHAPHAALHDHRSLAFGPRTEIACRLLFKPACDAPAPAHRQGGDDCPICWSMAVAAAMSLPAVATTPPPTLLSSPEAPTAPAPLARVMRTASFQARAPPSSLFL